MQKRKIIIYLSIIIITYMKGLSGDNVRKTKVNDFHPPISFSNKNIFWLEIPVNNLDIKSLRDKNEKNKTKQKKGRKRKRTFME